MDLIKRLIFFLTITIFLSSAILDIGELVKWALLSTAIGTNGSFSVHDLANFNLFENHDLEFIFTGHLHINLETQYKNTKIIVTSALGLPLGNDPSGFRIIEFKNEKLSYDFFKI